MIIAAGLGTIVNAVPYIAGDLGVEFTEGGFVDSSIVLASADVPVDQPILDLGNTNPISEITGDVPNEQIGFELLLASSKYASDDNLFAESDLASGEVSIDQPDL